MDIIYIDTINRQMDIIYIVKDKWIYFTLLQITLTSLEVLPGLNIIDSSK